MDRDGRRPLLDLERECPCFLEFGYDAGDSALGELGPGTCNFLYAAPNFRLTRELRCVAVVGLVPDVTETEDLQLSRVMMQLGHKATDLDRYIYLNNLLDHNETLFYRTVMSDPARFLPIVYDPTIAEACLKYGHIYRTPRGMYLSITRRGKVKQILKNWPQEDVRFICVTDGGRILGLGILRGAPN